MKKFVCLLLSMVVALTMMSAAIAENVGYTAEEVWCVNEDAAVLYGEGDAKIFGTMYYPKNFDPAQTYPMVVISHGFANSSALLNFDTFPWVSELTNLGCVVYGFDFCGGAPAGGMLSTKSDGAWEDMSIMTEVDDLRAVIDFVKSLEYVNDDQIYLMGQSQGGFVTAIAASQLESESQNVAGIILLWPAFSMLSEVQQAFPTAESLPTEPTDWAGQKNVGTRYFSDVYNLNLEELISAYSGNVLVIHGMADTSVPYTASVEVMDKFYADNPDAELVLVAGAGHTFVGRGGSPDAVSIAVTNVNHSLEMWMGSNAQ